ncbi:hypothetical protein EDD86DRAFT_64511 [Gorgonomyces haynaldii]|nr:hypothetical protein EDD86DRAFT_64511 [Gorgonomyces haynaldii]
MLSQNVYNEVGKQVNKWKQDTTSSWKPQYLDSFDFISSETLNSSEYLASEDDRATLEAFLAAGDSKTSPKAQIAHFVRNLQTNEQPDDLESAESLLSDSCEMELANVGSMSVHLLTSIPTDAEIDSPQISEAMDLLDMSLLNLQSLPLPAEETRGLTSDKTDYVDLKSDKSQTNDLKADKTDSVESYRFVRPSKMPFTPSEMAYLMSKLQSIEIERQSWFRIFKCQ